MSGQLINAIKARDQARDQARVHALVEADQGLAEERDESGISALMLAHYYGLDGAPIRVARRSSLDVFEAATVGDLGRLEELLQADPALVRAVSADGTTALHYAAFFEQPAAAALLLDRGADPHAVAEAFGRVTPLHSAATVGNNAAARALLDAGAEVNARQEGGFAALHAAALNGNDEMVANLIAAGAELTLATDEGQLAADLAAESGHDSLAQRLRPATDADPKE